MINWIHAGPSVTAACLGSLVECVGAATIVLAVGTVRGWRSALLGTASGLAVLTALVFVLGPVLGVIPVTALQFVIGLLLLSPVFYSCCSASAGCVKPCCGPRGPSLSTTSAERSRARQRHWVAPEPRRRADGTPSQALDDDGEPGMDWSPRVEDPALRNESRRVLAAAIDELPPDYRTAVVLRDVEGLSNHEISEALGITVANVKTRVHRARLFLRKRLASDMSDAPFAACLHESPCTTWGRTTASLPHAAHEWREGGHAEAVGHGAAARAGGVHRRQRCLG
jgi:Sigma-70, region 4